jgi:NDP-sugar pyrophosphorylase family protein
MLLLITAAGLGSRFQRQGLTTPKPLIRVQNRTLLEHTLDSFRLNATDRLVIAVQRAHGIPEQLDAQLRSSHPGVALHWLELDGLLQGQLATAVAALERSNSIHSDSDDTPLLIHNCDTGFAWQEELRPSRQAYGGMAVFEAEGEHWSFGKPDPSDPGRAIAIAEKRRISDLASIGLYGFRSCQEFLTDARSQLASVDTVGGEHYVAPLLNTALERGAIVLLPRVAGVRLYGTPEELCASFAISREELARENGQA